MSLANLPLVLNLVFALFGVSLTLYIYHKKSSHKAMVCPLNGHCETVMNSKFSRFFGIPVELIGLCYYASVAFAYGIFLGAPGVVTPALTVATFFISMVAFLFTAYLVFIQVFYIRQLCTWCLFSAALSTAIFGVAFFIGGSAALTLVLPYIDLVLSAYIVALAVGLGSATIASIFVGKFLKDLHVSTLEADLIHLISQITWLALGLLFITGSTLYVAGATVYAPHLFSPLQLLIVFVMIGAGALLDLLITPKLIQISLGQDRIHHMGELRWLRQLAFGLTGISLISWYMAFILAMVNQMFDVRSMGLAYVVLLVIGVITTQIAESRMAR